MDEKTTGQADSESPPMHVREIELKDGRYMVFFTFGDEEADEGSDV